jgi:phosphoribosylglycinamide formyltransferase-1
MSNTNHNPIRIVVFVSGGGTNLQALINQQQRGDNPCGEIAGVIASKSTAYALERAKNAGIPTAVLTDNMMADVAAFKPDLIVTAGFLRMLAADVCRAYKNRVLNIHPSLIPSFCGKGFYGLKVHEAVLARGVKLTGATVHLCDPDEYDSGPIILQKAVPVLPGDDAKTLQQRVMTEAEQIILPQAVKMFCEALSQDKNAEYPFVK